VLKGKFPAIRSFHEGVNKVDIQKEGLSFEFEIDALTINSFKQTLSVGAVNLILFDEL
jgi:hypothetical protein